MESLLSMHSEVFLDTLFAIALSAPSDRLHDRALHLAKMLQATETRLVTTQATTRKFALAIGALGKTVPSCE